MTPIGRVIQVTIFEAAMAPMIGASIVAQEHKLDPPLITLMMQIPTEVGQGFRGQAGQHSEMKSATVPI